MSYYSLLHRLRGFACVLLVLLVFRAQAQQDDPPGLIESSPLDTPAEFDTIEPAIATNLVSQSSETNLVQESVAPPVRYDPPPPQIIQVQLPTVPILAREDIELLVGRLASIEQRLVEQQTNTMAMVIRSNQSILSITAILGGLGLLGILSAAIVLMRAFNRFSDVMLTLPMGQQLGRGMSLNALALEELPPASSTALEQVSARFLGALEQLEKRVRELELEPSSLVAGVNATASVPGNGNLKANVNSGSANTLSSAGANVHPTLASAAVGSTPPDNEKDARRRILKLLEEGESLLQSDQFEDALSRFEEALTVEPRNSEALIKRGMALERLQRMDAALESYDRAIATNSSLTLAYLHKGAICNRLQRYREALECYERALQAEQKT